ncbi:MAG: hypothetical protein AB7O59_13560 [Pirellulales bacterium]
MKAIGKSGRLKIALFLTGTLTFCGSAHAIDGISVVTATARVIQQDAIRNQQDAIRKNKQGLAKLKQARKALTTQRSQQSKNLDAPVNSISGDRGTAPHKYFLRTESHALKSPTTTEVHRGSAKTFSPKGSGFPAALPEVR